MLPETQINILAAGRREFLEKGFNDASLRSIAADAGVTTGAIYGYYPDKSALFSALVEQAAWEFKEKYRTLQRAHTAISDEEKLGDRGDMNPFTDDELQQLLRCIYDNFDAFCLIVSCSAGTEYESYIESIIDMETEYTKTMITTIERAGYQTTHLSKNLIHILSSAYFSALFETVAHKMKETEAYEYIQHISSFFRSGWNTLFRLPAV